MSRSYKKTPYCGDIKGKQKKKYANHRVRSQLKNLDYNLNHKQYRKMYPTYNICDYYFKLSWNEYWTACLKEWKTFGREHNISYPNKKDEYRKWKKLYNNK